jgi:hypothetical protein
MLERSLDITSASSRQDLDELAELVARVRDGHKAVQAAVANALAVALEAGDAVLALQQELQNRGIGWQAWFREWGYFPLSTAKLYAQLAAHRAEIETARAQDPELSLRGARRLIGKSQPTTEEQRVRDYKAHCNEIEAKKAKWGLEARLKHFESQNVELRSEVRELKAALANKLAAVSNEKLLAELERRLSPLFLKTHQAAIKAIRRALESLERHVGPTLDLKAIPVTDSEVTKH